MRCAVLTDTLLVCLCLTAVYALRHIVILTQLKGMQSWHWLLFLNQFSFSMPHSSVPLRFEQEQIDTMIEVSGHLFDTKCNKG